MSSTDTDPSDAPAATGSTEPQDKQRRQRAAVARALAEPAVKGSGRWLNAQGVAMDYQVEAGFLPVMDNELGEQHDEPLAAVFTTAYQQQGADAAQRPVCFAFNGGPGSSSVFLHLGALGPMRVRIGDDGSMPAPPYRAEPNPLAWFEFFDLVFIDPPHTGYSLAASEEARKRLFSVDGDVAALCEVMRAWLTRHGRWGSPVYLCGESYGTTRGAAMADLLASQGLALAGLILVSSAMDIQALDFSPRNDLAYGLFLPAFAGVAQYHGCLSGPLAASAEAAREAAEAFVEEEYLAALHQGARLQGKARRRIARRLGELCGLHTDLVEQKNLRISDETFFFELLRSRSQLVGRLDARVAGPMSTAHLRAWEFDPGLEPLSGPYTMAALDYFGQQLGLSRERRFVVSSAAAHKAWNWNRGSEQGTAYACTSPDLARAMRRLPHLRVFVASGLFDLGTPYSATNWMLDQLEIPATVRERLVHRTYGAGHMMYTREADIRQLRDDLAAWLPTAAGA